MPAAATPLAVFTMRSTDRQDPAIEFAKDLPVGDSIASATSALWQYDTVPPTAVTGTILDGSPTASGSVVKQFIKLPQAGMTYQLDITITTAQARTKTESLLIVVGWP